MKLMRQSLLSTADICQTRLEYSLDPDRPKRGGVVRAMGTAYHAGLDHLYTARLNDSPTSLGSVLDAAGKGFSGAIQYADQFNWRVNERVWTFGEAWEVIEGMLFAYIEQGCEWPSEYNVVSVEQKFTLPWRDDWYRSGTIDLLLYHPKSEWYTIVDHKTSGRRWSKSKSSAASSPQGAWYVDAFTEILDTDKVTFAYDVMTYSGVFERFDAPRNNHQIDLTRSKAVMVASLIDRQGPFLPNPSSNLCSETYCDWWRECPWGQSLNRVD